MSAHDRTAQRIEQTLAAHRVNARVWEARVLPALTRYSLTVAIGQKVDGVTGLANELALALGARSIRVERHAGQICIDVPRPDRREVSLTALLAKAPGKRACAALGLDMEGRALLLALESPDVPHALVSGMTGSGKTELLRSMVASLTVANRPGLLQVLVCDVAGNLAGACPARHLWLGRAPAMTPAECAAALAYAAAQVDRRRECSLPRLVVVVDELADLLMAAPEVSDALLRLTQRGRQAAINVFAATQRPAAVLVGGMVKANFPVRIVGSVASPEDAKVASGIGGTGAERLLGRGDFLLVARGEVIRFQAARAQAGARVDLTGLESWQDATTSTAVPVDYNGLLPALLPEHGALDLAVATADAVAFASLRDGRWRRPVTTEAQAQAIMHAHERTGRSIAGTVKAIGWSYDDWSVAQVKDVIGLAPPTNARPGSQ